MKTLLSLLVPVLALTACGSNAPAPEAPDAAAPAGPSLALSTDPPTVTAGDPFTLVVDISNFDVIDPRTSPPVMPGQGHFHYAFDDWGEDYEAGWTDTIEIATTTASAPGVHTVHAWLVDSIHGDIDPPVDAMVEVTLE